MSKTVVETGESSNELLAGIYEHYKSVPGNPKYYLVLGVGRHSETEEEGVVYVPLYPAGGPRMTFRPLAKFMGDVEVNGIQRRRFTYVGTEIPEFSV